MRVEGPQESRTVQPTVRFLREHLANETSEWTLNWGSTRSLPGRVVQSPSAVRLCSNKPSAKLKMWTDGVPTPTVCDPHSALLLVGSHRPLVGRPTQHLQGRGFHLCRSPGEVERAVECGASHFTEFIEATKEFRVHVIADKVVKISEKVGGTGVVRNHRHSWVFRVPTLPREDRGPIRDAAKAAVRSLGLDLGAADILWRDGEVWVTEVNAAPSLIDASSNTGQKYIRHIKEVWCGP